LDFEWSRSKQSSTVAKCASLRMLHHRKHLSLGSYSRLHLLYSAYCAAVRTATKTFSSFACLLAQHLRLIDSLCQGVTGRGRTKAYGT